MDAKKLAGIAQTETAAEATAGGPGATDALDVTRGALAGGAARRDLDEAFMPWRTSVNRSLVLRAALDGATVGALAGAAFAGGAWATHHYAWRFGGLAFAAVGGIVGALLGARRTWNDGQIALYVDGVLGTPETVTSAVELGREAPSDVVDAAILALRSGATRPPHRLRRRHSLALVGTIACVAAFALRAPKPAQAAPATGTEIVKLAEVPGLDKIAEVEKLPAKDDAQRKRLEDIAKDARELKKKLIEGMPRREALDRLRKLQQRLEAEREELGGGERKPGLDAAAGALKENGFPGLSDALEERDLQSFDEMMERLANDREEKDREKAKDALDKAIAEAKKKGADDVAKQLEKEKARLEKRAEKGDALRDLGDALKGTPGDPGKSLKDYEKKGTDDSARDLADSLRKGLEKLSPDERKRLAERLEKEAERGGADGKMSPHGRKRLKDLADKLKTPEGQKELENRLRDYANGDDGDKDKTDEEKRQEGLEDGEDGADDAEKGLGDDGKGGDKGDKGDGKGKGKGKGDKGKGDKGDGKGDKGDGKGDKGDGKGDGKGDKGDGKGDGKGDKGDGDGDGDGKGDGKGNGNGNGNGMEIGDGAGGPGPGGGKGDHRGKSKKLDAETLKARARGVNGGAGSPKPGGWTERSSGNDGSKSTVKGTGDLGAASAGDVNGVDRAEVPEAVRRQVKSYFE
jgi:hypothetical protein